MTIRPAKGTPSGAGGAADGARLLDVLMRFMLASLQGAGRGDPLDRRTGGGTSDDAVPHELHVLTSTPRSRSGRDVIIARVS